MTKKADHDAVAKIIKQLDENGRYQRFIASLAQAESRRDETSSLVLKNFSGIKSMLNRFVAEGTLLSVEDQDLITAFLMRWDAHLSDEKSGIKAAARTDAPEKVGEEALPSPKSENRGNSKRRWGEFFHFRNRKQISSVSSSGSIY